MPREVPTTKPPVEVIKLAPNEVVTGADFRSLVLLQNFLYSQAGSRVAGKVYSPTKVFTTTTLELLGMYVLPPLKPQGGGFFFMCAMNGHNSSVRFEFREPDNTLVGVATVNSATAGYHQVEASVATSEESIRLLVYGSETTGGVNGDLSTFLVNAAPLDPSRDW